MNIAVYSGSFNPLHIGHLAIIKHLIEEAGFDKVYMIVSPKNPLKDGISSDSARDRYKAALAAVARHFSSKPIESTERYISSADSTTGKVKVDNIELTMPEPHYTIRTLDALKERESGNNFTLTIGSDNLASIRKWKDYTRILKEYGVAVFPRTGFDTASIRTDLLREDPDYRITLLKAEMVDISSTTIREAIASGQDVSAWLM